MEHLTEIKDLVTIAKPIIDPLITAFIKPKIDQLGNWLRLRSIENKVEDNFFENKFEEYIARTYENCKNINILIFQNQQIKINEIYQPLTIQSRKDNSAYTINDFEISFLETYKKIIISDTAGMGKSTIAKWVCLKILETSQSIPILIELRNLKDNNNVLDEIYYQINPIDKDFDKELILKFIEIGNFTIIFDGFDEIQIKSQEKIIKDIRDFINKTGNNLFILTSRPEGALSAFGDFQLFNILPLKKEESFALIKKYDSICPVKIGDKLIRDIEQNFKQTQELLQNPFLVSLIYSTYTYNQDIPSTKITFYEEIYSALFKRHDLSKDGWTRPKKSKLDIQQFKVVTRQLAFDTAILGEIAYTEPELINHLQIAIKKCPGIDINVSDFFDDLLSAVPLFQRDGSKIKWAHKSLQDYFTADFIAFDSRKEQILSRIYKSEREGLLNMLELFYELDFKTFRKTIINNLLEELIKHNKNSYVNVQNIPIKHLQERKSLTFEQKFGILKMESRTPANKIVSKANSMEIFSKLQIRNLTVVQTNLVVGIAYSFKRQLLNLILEKEPDYLSNVQPKTNLKFTLPRDGAVEIDEDPNSIANDPKNFQKINSVLSNYFYSKKYNVIDFVKVNNEHQKIALEIEIEKSTDSFKDI